MEYFEGRKMWVSDSFYASDDTGETLQGFISVREKNLADIKWVIGMTNSNGERSRGFYLHSGFVVTEVSSAVSISASEKVITKYSFFTNDELKTLVTERLDYLREFYLLEYERESHFKKIRLSSAEAHNIICDMIRRDVIAGRLSKEMLDLWHKPTAEYLRPRTMWSLFCLSSWLLNRLNVPVMIERTTNLHHFFDEVADFNKKPTKWVQSTFA
jgi:hypothetical protein